MALLYLLALFESLLTFDIDLSANSPFLFRMPTNLPAADCLQVFEHLMGFERLLKTVILLESQISTIEQGRLTRLKNVISTRVMRLYKPHMGEVKRLNPLRLDVQLPLLFEWFLL